MYTSTSPVPILTRDTFNCVCSPYGERGFLKTVITLNPVRISTCDVSSTTFCMYTESFNLWLVSSLFPSSFNAIR